MTSFLHRSIIFLFCVLRTKNSSRVYCLIVFIGDCFMVILDGVYSNTLQISRIEL